MFSSPWKLSNLCWGTPQHTFTSIRHPGNGPPPATIQVLHPSPAFQYAFIKHKNASHVQRVYLICVSGASAAQTGFSERDSGDAEGPAGVHGAGAPPPSFPHPLQSSAVRLKRRIRWPENFSFQFIRDKWSLFSLLGRIISFSFWCFGVVGLFILKRKNNQQGNI